MGKNFAAGFDSLSEESRSGDVSMEEDEESKSNNNTNLVVGSASGNLLAGHFPLNNKINNISEEGDNSSLNSGSLGSDQNVTVDAAKGANIGDQILQEGNSGAPMLIPNSPLGMETQTAAGDTLEHGEINESPTTAFADPTAFVDPRTASRLNARGHIVPNYQEGSKGADGPHWEAGLTGDTGYHMDVEEDMILGTLGQARSTRGGRGGRGGRGPKGQDFRPPLQTARSAPPPTQEDLKSRPRELCDLAEAQNYVGSALHSLANSALTHTKAETKMDILATAARLNLSDHIFLGKTMMITGFTVGNCSNPHNRTVTEISYLLKEFGIEGDYTGVQIVIAHTVGDKVDLMITLQNRQLFGAMSHMDAEAGVYVIQAIQSHHGTVFGSKGTNDKRYYLMHVLDMALDVVVKPNDFRDLLFGRGIPQPAPTHTAFCLMLLWGLKSVEAVLRGIRAISMYDLVCYVSFTNVSRKGGGGYREYYVKVFNMAPIPADERHAKYRAAVGFSSESVGIKSYSLGIYIVRYPDLMRFNEGRTNTGLDIKVAYSVLDSVPPNVSVASVIQVILNDSWNEKLITNSEGLPRIKMGLLCPIPKGRGACRIYLIWEGAPVSNLHLVDLHLAIQAIGGKGLGLISYPSLRELYQWETRPGPTTHHVQQKLQTPSLTTQAAWSTPPNQFHTPISSVERHRRGQEDTGGTPMPAPRGSITRYDGQQRQVALTKKDIAQQLQMLIANTVVPMLQAAMGDVTLTFETRLAEESAERIAGTEELKSQLLTARDEGRREKEALHERLSASEEDAKYMKDCLAFLVQTAKAQDASAKTTANPESGSSERANV